MGPKGSMFEGKTLDDAVRKGLDSLGMSRAEVMINVVEEGSGGFLGLGARPYKVIITPRPGGPPRDDEDRDRERRGGRGRREGSREGRRSRGEGAGGRGERNGRGRRGEARSGEGRGGEGRSGEGRGGEGRSGEGRGGEGRSERRGGDRERRGGDRERRGGRRQDDRTAEPREARAQVPAPAEMVGEEAGERRRRRRGRRGGRGRRGERRGAPQAESAVESMPAPQPEAVTPAQDAAVAPAIPAEAVSTPAAAESWPERREPAVAEQAPAGEERPEPLEAAPVDREERLPEPVSAPARAAEPAAETMDAAALAESGRRWTEDLMKAMGFEAQVSATADGDRVDVTVQVSERDDLLTGPKGEVRQAMQHLLNRMINRGEGSRYHLQLEVNDFWAQREEELRRLAHDLAAEALEKNDEVVTEYLNSQERRIVHVTLRDDERVKTYSLGTGMIKRLAIAPADFPEDGRTDD